MMIKIESIPAYIRILKNIKYKIRTQDYLHRNTDQVRVCARYLFVHRLAKERMSREVAESRLRLQEDQLAELQEELRRVSENSSDSLQTVITHTHTHTQM